MRPPLRTAAAAAVSAGTLLILWLLVFHPYHPDRVLKDEPNAVKQHVRVNVLTLVCLNRHWTGVGWTDIRLTLLLFANCKCGCFLGRRLLTHNRFVSQSDARVLCACFCLHRDVLRGISQTDSDSYIYI